MFIDTGLKPVYQTSKPLGNGEPESLGVPFEVPVGQFQRYATPRTLQSNARRHDADGLVEEVHWVFAGNVN